MENTEQNLIKNNNRKLSEKETIKLVELYGENECLWNFRNKDYKNKNKRNECYEMIKNELNLESVAVVKKKIKSIRDTFNAEKGKVKKSYKSGAGTDDVYHSKLVWYNTMAGFLTQSEGRSSYKTSTGEREKDDSSTGNYDNNKDSSCEIPHVEEKIEIPPQPYKKRKMKTDTSENIFTAIDQLRQLKNETTQDEYYYFGQSIASQLRAMPDKICAAETQLQIQNLLSKKKIVNLKKKTFEDQRCSSPFSSYNSSTTDSPNILEEAVNMIFDENEELI